jgi:hypothetical protein
MGGAVNAAESNVVLPPLPLFCAERRDIFSGVGGGGAFADGARADIDIDLNTADDERDDAPPLFRFSLLLLIACTAWRWREKRFAVLIVGDVKTSRE